MEGAAGRTGVSPRVFEVFKGFNGVFYQGCPRGLAGFKYPQDERFAHNHIH